MKRLVLELGLYNATFWLALICAGYVALRGRLPSKAWRGWKPVAFLVILGTVLNLGMGLGRAFVSPRDFLQDIVSAKEYLEGRSMYPDGMTDRFAKLLAEEDTNRKLDLGWTLSQLSEKSREATLNQHWVQAHPPFMSAFFAGLYRLFGLLGAQIALALLSLACLVWSTAAIASELKPGWGRWRTVAFAAAFCGSGPVVTSLRNGQVDSLLLALLVAAWVLLRRGREFAAGAGVAVGIAVSFKLIPALLFPVLFIRWPRAFAGALATALLVCLLVLLNTGTGVWADYRRTAEGIILEYAGYPSNVSLLGLLTRDFRFFGGSADAARTAWQYAGILIAGGLMGLVHWKRSDCKAGVDFPVALATGLMPLCSPVAWDHYLTFLALPAAVAAVRLPGRYLAAFVLIWAIPETAYLNILEGCRELGWEAAAVWVVSPLRTYAMFGLIGRLAIGTIGRVCLISRADSADESHTPDCAVGYAG